MSNKVKKIIGLALAFNVISSAVPTTLSIGQKQVYAAESYVLTTLDISSINGSSLKLYDDKKCKSNDKISDSDLDDTKTIYSKISSSKKGIEIDNVKASNGNVEIYVSGKKIDTDDEIKISAGSSKTITFKIVDENGKEQNKYTLKVTREGKDDDDDDDDYGDDVYLSNIILYYNWNDLDLDFKKNTKTYNINVDKDVTFLRIEAEPEDDDYSVRVNDESLNEDDDWQTKVGIKEGKNEIKIVVKDDDDENERTYTVNITRGSSNEATNSTTNSNNNSTSTTKNTGWKYTNGKWQYYDVNGNLYKSSWVTDAKGKSYYLGADGNMVTGWITLSGNQYYFDLVSGERKTGWICFGKEWYQFDSTGVLVK